MPLAGITLKWMVQAYLTLKFFFFCKSWINRNEILAKQALLK